MNLDRPYLKQQAKALLSTARPSPISAAAVYVALSALMGFLSARLVGVSYETVERAMRFLEQGKADYALTILSAAQPAPSAWLINLALELVMWIVAVGFTIFVLNTLRGTGAALGNLLDGFGFFGRILLLNFVTGILVLLWSLLLIVHRAALCGLSGVPLGHALLRPHPRHVLRALQRTCEGVRHQATGNRQQATGNRGQAPVRRGDPCGRPRIPHHPKGCHCEERSDAAIRKRLAAKPFSGLA